MRRYDEAVEVRAGRIGEGIGGLDTGQLATWPEGPAQFVWRERLWRVLGVQARWIESGAWWAGPAVRAARGEDAATRPDMVPGMHGEPIGRSDGSATETGTEPGVDDSDLLCEQEVWRVEAANGREGSRGVYELAHTWVDGSWRLRAVVD